MTFIFTLIIVLVFGVLWALMAIFGMIRTAPAISDFVQRSQMEISLLLSVSSDRIANAIAQMSGVVNRDGQSMMVSLSPSIRSIERGTGAWVKVILGDENWLLQVRRVPLNWVSCGEAIDEFDRELPMALSSMAAVSFDIREGVIRPNGSTGVFHNDVQISDGQNEKWWE